MITKDQIEAFLKRASLPDETREVFSDIVEGYLESMELCEKQAEELEQKNTELANLKSDTEIKLQKVASIDVIEKTAGSVADELIANQLISAESKPDMVTAVSENPEKMASIVRNIFNALIPTDTDGSGLDRPTQQVKEGSSRNVVPADDPFMEVIRNGA